MAITVRDAASLKAALGTVAPGTTILLAGGDYGDFSASPGWQYDFTGNVTLQALDPNNPPVFKSLYFQNIDNITLSGLKIDIPAATNADANTFGSIYGLKLVNVSGVVIEDMLIEGHPAVGGKDPSVTPDGTPFDLIKGYYQGAGMLLQDVSDIVVRDTEVKGVVHGIRGVNIFDMDVVDNHFHELRGTAVSGGNFSHILIDNNEFDTFRSWKYGGDGDHGDVIHIWTRPGYNDGPNRDIVITNNFMHQGDGSPIMGIYIDDDGYGIGTTGVRIEDNVLIMNHIQNILFENTHNSVIRNNTILDSGDRSGSIPAILLTDGGSGVTVDKNIMAAPVVIRAGATSGNSIGDNLIAQRDFPEDPNYYDDLFANALAANPDLADLVALPGSLIDTRNYGADQTQPDTTPNAPMGFILDASGEELANAVHTLSAGLIYDQNGKVNTAGASVTWDFGDGRSGTGIDAVHSYDKPGLYDATATVRLADGRTVVLEKTVLAETPKALLADFDNGKPFDSSGINNPASTSGNVSFSGGVATLNGGAIKYQANAETLDNSAVSILIDFKKASTSDGGQIFNFGGAFTVNLRADWIQISVTTDTGIKWLQPNAAINNTNWHKLAITYSSDDRTISVYLDGKELMTQTGVTGSFVPGNLYHQLEIGNGTFRGSVDNATYLRGALDATDIADLHAGRASLDTVISRHTGDVPSGGSTGSGSSGGSSGGDTGSGSSGGSSDPGTGVIRGTIFIDADNDGRRDADETVIHDAKVELLSSSGSVIKTMQSYSNGSYAFDGLDAGTYSVRATYNGQTRSNANIQLDAGERDVSNNVGFPGSGDSGGSGGSSGGSSGGGSGSAEIRGTVFVDSDGDGVRDSGEAAVHDAKVELLSSSGSVLATTQSYANGSYAFDGLAAGTYAIRATKDGLSKIISNIQLDAGERELYGDAGLTSGGSTGSGSSGGSSDPGTGVIRGTIFIDADNDGRRDADETVIHDAKVELLSSSGSVIKTMQSYSNGSYAFDGLDAGTYSVRATYNGQTRSNANIQLDAGERDVSNNVGFPGSGGSSGGGSSGGSGSAEIRGTVFVDSDRDGVQDSGEWGIHNARVDLFLNGNVVETMQSYSNGSYAFDGLAAGTYAIRATKDGVTKTLYNVSLSSGERELGGDIGLNGSAKTSGTATIRGKAFDDADGDGSRDAGEDFAAGARVRLFDADGNKIAVTTANDNGWFAFKGLAAGSYSVSARDDSTVSDAVAVALSAGEDEGGLRLGLDGGSSASFTAARMASGDDLSLTEAAATDEVMLAAATGSGEIACLDAETAETMAEIPADTGFDAAAALLHLEADSGYMM